ncbi:hypothetical protein [Maribacter sp. 2307ULW6-5]|uniref:hypothetical protein n=1 Tax=Maribacter sp. 2307ULW6-5 TaxID=3386275 RepID=UPI0039BC7EDE
MRTVNKLKSFFRGHTLALAALMFASNLACAKADPPPTIKASKVASVDVLHFGDANTLFVGDTQSGSVFALQIADKAAQEGQFVVYDLDQRIADLLGAKIDHIKITDMVINPVSNEAYVGVQRGKGTKGEPAIVVVNPKDSSLRLLELDKTDAVEAKLNALPDNGAMFQDRAKLRSFSITDIVKHENQIFVSGISSGEFASSLYKIPFPFTGKVNKSTVQVYHPVHNQNETRAPIRTMAVVDLDGVPHLVASFLCTPLTAIPLTDIKDNQHITGKTIAELGYGNYPIDLVPFSMNGGSFVMISNSHRPGMMINVADIASYSKKPGITTPVDLQKQPLAGVPYNTIPLAGVTQMDNQGPMYLALTRRNATTGSLELVSTVKGAFFRVSDMVAEFDFPDYSYPEDNKVLQGMIKPARTMLLQQEGLGKFTKE